MLQNLLNLKLKVLLNLIYHVNFISLMLYPACLFYTAAPLAHVPTQLSIALIAAPNPRSSNLGSYSQVRLGCKSSQKAHKAHHDSSPALPTAGRQSQSHSTYSYASTLVLATCCLPNHRWALILCPVVMDPSPQQVATSAPPQNWSSRGGRSLDPLAATKQITPAHVTPNIRAIIIAGCKKIKC